MYDYNITIDQLRDVRDEYDGHIYVIINGEYYLLTPDAAPYDNRQ